MNSKIINRTEEMEAVIKEAEVCYIAMVDLNNRPYVLPFNFGYENGILYLHSSPVGRKMDILKQHPDVCVMFSIGHQLHHHNEEVACSYSMKYRSVMAYGKVEFIEDYDEKVSLLNKVMTKYTGKEFSYAAPAVKNVACYTIKLENMTGKNRGY